MTGKPNQGSWHQSIPFGIVLVIIIGPLGLPVIWFNRKLNFLQKVGVSVIVIAMAFIFYAMIQGKNIL